MNEEEIIKIIKYMLENKNTDINVIINYQAIQGLLDLYKKEKQKNISLEQENQFLKMMYRNTDEFKAIDRMANGKI